VDINPSVSGGTVTVGQTVGQIQNLDEGPHLHLNEIQVSPLDLRINPQRVGGMLFSDADQPQFKSITVGSVSNDIILVPQYGGTGAPGDQTYTPFNYVGGTFYVSGEVAVMVGITDGVVQTRKGVYSAMPGFSVAGNSQFLSGPPNISFDTLFDGAERTTLAVRTIYFSQNTNSNTFFPTNQKINGNPYLEAWPNTWNTAGLSGQYSVCVYSQGYPQATKYRDCTNAYIDSVQPAMIFEDSNNIPWSNQTATSSTTIVVAGSDTGSGVYNITVQGPAGFTTQSSTNPSPGPSNPSYAPTFTGLTVDGQYTATVTDLAGNQASLSFIVSTAGPSGGNGNGNGTPISTGMMTNDNCLVSSATSLAGMQSISVSGPTGFSPISTSFNCSAAAVVGPFCGLSSGTYTITDTDCAGLTNSTPNTVSVTTGAPFASITGTCAGGTQSSSFQPTSGQLTSPSVLKFTSGGGVTNFGGTFQTDWQQVCLEQEAFGPGALTTPCHLVQSAGNGWVETEFTNPALLPGGFGVSNASTFPAWNGVSVNLESASINFSGTDLGTGGGMSGTIDVSGANQPRPVSSSNGVASSVPTYSHITIGPGTCTPADTLLQQLVAQLLYSVLPGQNPYCFAGSEAVFLSPVPMNFSFQGPSGVVIDTTTLGIYGYDLSSGVWTETLVTNQSVTISSTGFIVASGSYTRTGTYGVYFQGHDSTAPVTTFSIQGSSFNFDGTAFFSTATYVVLTATDPIVNGFASTVATITYCLDPSSGSVFSVYTSSIPLYLGTHVFQYRSYDYAGNAEALNTTTFTVTAGAAFKGSSDDTINGNLLVGLLGSGAQAEVVARVQDVTALQVSSANHQPLLNVSNYGNVGVGVQIPIGQLDLGSSDVALHLKSGNLTSTGSSVQAAFGYNGDVSLRHAIRTFHSTSTIGNEMDFLVWTPDAGSTTTIATTELLALQASTITSSGSMHILPIGPPDAELVVSNGVTTGGGTMQRLQVLTPSSKRFKSDITYLKGKDEDRALAETAALKHVRFRYRSTAKDGSLYDDPVQPVRVGLIYEDAPEGIRGQGPVLADNERLANVELALKAAMRKLDALEKRYQALKARKAQ
jgi:hypothetical protein